MKIYTKAVSKWDFTRQRYVTDASESVWFEYAGKVALCKGDSTDAATEQLQNQQTEQDMNFASQLQSVFQQQFSTQQTALNYLNGQMQTITNNPQGYSPAALAAMRTSATDQLSTQYQSAQQALNAQQFASGSRDLPSGVNSQLSASLLNSEATDKAAAQNNITVQNANLANQNFWNATNVENGVAAEENPQSYAAAATGSSAAGSSAANAVAADSNANTNANSNSFGGALAKGFGSTLGSGLGTILTG